MKEWLEKVCYVIGFGIGLVISYFRKLFKLDKKSKRTRGQSTIQCSKCGSSNIMVTSTVEHEVLNDENGKPQYDKYTYAIRCLDCNSAAIFTEKWDRLADVPRLYLNYVEDITDVQCPYCGSKGVKESDTMQLKTDEQSDLVLYACKKCGKPVCVSNRKK